MANREVVAEQLVKRYSDDIVAVDDISFMVDSGQVFGFLGPNGAGKSTTIKILTSLALPSSGRATVGGYDVVPEADRARRIMGAALQDIGVGGLLTVIGLAVLPGTGFAGFTVSAALGSGSAAVTQSAGFVFSPLTFLAASLVPLDLLDGWLKAAASADPITYVLGAMRDTVNAGWVGESLWQGALACLLLAVAMYAPAVFALRARTRRS